MPDHVIVWNERSQRHLQHDLAYFHVWGTHPSLDKAAPLPRAAQPLASGAIVPVPHVGLQLAKRHERPREFGRMAVARAIVRPWQEELKRLVPMR